MLLDMWTSKIVVHMSSNMFTCQATCSDIIWYLNMLLDMWTCWLTCEQMRLRLTCHMTCSHIICTKILDFFFTSRIRDLAVRTRNIYSRFYYECKSHSFFKLLIYLKRAIVIFTTTRVWQALNISITSVLVSPEQSGELCPYLAYSSNAHPYCDLKTIIII